MIGAGTRLGQYEIQGPLGAGGMGEVYRARDLKLGRDVAIKLLPAAFASDPDRRARLEREARLLASLNHPHIATIHGVEDTAGVYALVMELVEGPTLEEKLAGSRLQPPGSGTQAVGLPKPVARSLKADEALAIARQIADALDAAHEKGIVHRDLKPANIKLTADGVVKVLDFGLATAVTQPQGELSASPTISPTRIGTVVGTAAYMSPEQARGLAVDKRTDIWAFGCVLYEMLAGRQAFTGATGSDVMAHVLEREPDWSALPANAPAGVLPLLRRCLEKDPKHRLRDVGDAWSSVDDAPRATPSNRPQPATSGRERLVWISALAVAGLIAAGAIVRGRLPAAAVPSASEVRAEINTPATTDAVSFAISPDGERIVFAAISEGRSRLWLRPLSSAAVRPLAGTDGASYPFWSPDSRSVGFFADGKLKRVDVEAAAVRELAAAQFPSGGTWSREGVILFVPGAGRPVVRVPENGGELGTVTRMRAPDESNHRSPRFLPDGRRFLYYVTGTPDVRGIYVGSLDGNDTKRLVDADAVVEFVPPGQLLFVRQGILLTQAFDVASRTLSGTAAPVAEDIAVDLENVAPVSVSPNGRMVYRAGTPTGYRRLIWFDRSGHETGNVTDPDPASPLSPEMSSDGKRVVLYRTIDGNNDLWMLDTNRGVLGRFTFDPANEINPIWSPDGTRVIFGANRGGVFDIYQKPADGIGPATALLLKPPINKAPNDWSPDGQFILVRTLDPAKGYSIWAAPMGGAGEPFPVVDSSFNEREGQFAPDGRWIAYQSDESGRFEIYLRSFPDPTHQIRVSATGGAQVRWRRDGQELFFIGLDNRLMAAPVHRSDAGTLDVGSPVPLFMTRVGGAVLGPRKQQYLVSRDGQRFLMNTVTTESSSPLRVILNWKAVVAR
jgi:serine/threonine protein kinase